MFWWVVAQAAVPPAPVLDGLNPPWNQPHVIPASVSRSPMLRPVIAAGLVCEQTSQ